MYSTSRVPVFLNYSYNFHLIIVCGIFDLTVTRNHNDVGLCMCTYFDVCKREITTAYI